MPERVAIHRIVVGGEEKSRKVIEAGTRFNTEDYQIDGEQLKKLDQRRATREPRDQQRDDGGPRADSRMGRVVEGRSGPARDVTNPMPGDNEPPGRVLQEPADNRPVARRDLAEAATAGAAAAGRSESAAAAAAEPHETRRTRRPDTDL
jgi:hypothetical protein